MNKLIRKIDLSRFDPRKFDPIATLKNYNNNFRHFIANVFMLLRSNVFDILIFSIISALLSILVTNFVRKVMISIVLRVNNTTYVSTSNLSRLLLNNLSVNLVFLFLIVITLLSLFEIGGLMHCYANAQVGKDTTLSNMIAYGFRACQKAVSPENWPMILYIIILLPLTNIMTLSASTISLTVPGFIEEYLQQNSLSKFYTIFYIGLVLFELVYIFAMNIFVLQNSNFVKSCDRSRRLGSGYYFFTIFALGMLSLFLNFFFNSLSSIIIVNISDLLKFLGISNSGYLTSSAQTAEYILVLRNIMKAIFAPAINIAGLTALYFRYMEEKNLIASLSPQSFRLADLPKKAIISLSIIISVLIGINLLDLFINKSYLFEPVPIPMVCAHRGDNVHAPENTLPAFELAMYESMPWIELDVHQTKDDVIVVSHDENIRHMTGVNEEIHNLTFDELSQYKVLDSFPGDYEDVIIPSLDSVFKMIKESDMMVQVEIKPTPYDRDIERSILKVINDNDMRDRVLIISLDYDSIVRMKKLDPEIRTAYCMVLAMENISDIEYSDSFSIEEGNVTPDIVHKVHEDGGLVFCWTVDKEDNLQYLVSCGVDCIGTDDPLLIAIALDKADYSGGLSRILNIIMHSLSVGIG